jgi:hypothetical protein
MTNTEKLERYHYLSKVLRDELEGVIKDSAIEDVIKYLFEQMFEE